MGKAYASRSGVFGDGDTVYVAGTRDFNDLLHDIDIPLGQTEDLERYHSLVHYLDTVGARRAVGHSMGGSVVLEAARHYQGLHPVTYGAPVVSTSPGARHRDALDPVSMFDLGAVNHGIQVPHTYKGA